MTPRMKFLAPFALAIVVVSGAAACSSDSSHSSGSMTMTTVKVAADAPENGADVMFAQMMIVHHRQAVEMAQYALKNSSNPDVLAQARGVVATQGAEIAQLESWLQEWGQPLPDATHGAHMMSMDGMASDSDLQKLSTLTGPEFDRLYLELMIAHHKGAITMSNTELTDGKFPALKKLAAAMSVQQQTEIDQMKGYLIKTGMIG